MTNQAHLYNSITRELIAKCIPHDDSNAPFEKSPALNQKGRKNQSMTEKKRNSAFGSKQNRLHSELQKGHETDEGQRASVLPVVRHLQNGNDAQNSDFASRSLVLP